MGFEIIRNFEMRLMRVTDSYEDPDYFKSTIIILLIVSITSLMSQ